jgi:hypothetical protein
MTRVEKGGAMVSKSRKLAALVLSVAGLAGVGALPASALEADTGPIAEIAITTGTVSETFVDDGCVIALSAANGRDQATKLCTLTMTGHVSEARPAAVENIKKDKNLSSNQREELLAAAGTVKSKSYSNFISGGVYTVTQSGTFYYNGTRVWVTKAYLGYDGSQTCVANYFVPPWKVSNFEKSDTGSTTVRTVRCNFDVLQGGLFSQSRSLVAKPTKSGSVTYQIIQ